jgi:hypothetical protein
MFDSSISKIEDSKININATIIILGGRFAGVQVLKKLKEFQKK